MTIAYVEKTITAENVFTDSLECHGVFNCSFAGIAGTTKVTLQRSFDNGTTWKDVDYWDIDDDEEGAGQEIESGVLYRLGVKTDEYDSGTILARISF